MSPSCIWHFGDGIRSYPKECAAWDKQLFLTQSWGSRHSWDKGRVTFTWAPCSIEGVLCWGVSFMSQTNFLMLLYMMKSEKIWRALTWKKVDERQSVFSKRAVFARHYQGRVLRWEGWDSANFCRKVVICWVFARLCVDQIRNSYG